MDADDTSIGSGGDAIAPCNWLQHYENVLDAFHVPILHGTFSGTQFTEVMNQMPKVSWEYSPLGVKTVSIRTMDDGKIMRRVTEVALPTLRVVPNPFLGKFGRVECDRMDAADRRYALSHLHGCPGAPKKASSCPKGAGAPTNRKRWQDMSPEERREFPGDWEAQIGQGPITLHSEERLASSDRGIVLLRRLLQKQVDEVAARARSDRRQASTGGCTAIVFEAGNPG